jgi:hypothetical protein
LPGDNEAKREVVGLDPTVEGAALKIPWWYRDTDSAEKARVIF